MCIRVADEEGSNLLLKTMLLVDWCQLTSMSHQTDLDEECISFLRQHHYLELLMKTAGGDLFKSFDTERQVKSSHRASNNG